MLQVENFIEKISYNDGHFPKKELEEIIERQDVFIPELLRIVKDVRDRPEKYMGDENYLGDLYDNRSQHSTRYILHLDIS